MRTVASVSQGSTHSRKIHRKRANQLFTLANKLIRIGKQLTWSISGGKVALPWGNYVQSSFLVRNSKQIQKANRLLAIWSREGGSLLDETETGSVRNFIPATYSGKQKLFIARTTDRETSDLSVNWRESSNAEKKERSRLKITKNQFPSHREWVFTDLRGIWT